MSHEDAQQLYHGMDDDIESLSMSSLGDVPTTVTTGRPSVIKSNEYPKSSRRSVSTCPSTCDSSSVASGSVSRRRSNRHPSNRTLEREIIASLRAELAFLKAEAEGKILRAREEAENSRALAQKLIVENEMIRQEANDANARADRLEEEVRQLSSPAAALGRTWRNATKAIGALRQNVEGEVAGDAKSTRPSTDTDSCLGGVRKCSSVLTVEVPDEEETSITGGLRGMFQRGSSASSRRLNADLNASKRKLVTAEELLWDWDEGSFEGLQAKTAPPTRATNSLGRCATDARAPNANDATVHKCSSLPVESPPSEMPWDVQDCVSVASSQR